MGIALWLAVSKPDFGDGKEVVGARSEKEYKDR